MTDHKARHYPHLMPTAPSHLSLAANALKVFSIRAVYRELADTDAASR